MANHNIQELATKVKENVGKVIVGKEDVVDLIIIAMLCNGHILLEDVPGTGKTVLAKSLAASIDCKFSRIQFTPDLLPSDVTGINFFNMKESEFEFIPGPVFSNILLADENSVRSFGMYGRAPGHHRWQNDKTVRFVHGYRNTEPAGKCRCVPAA